VAHSGTVDAGSKRAHDSRPALAGSCPGDNPDSMLRTSRAWFVNWYGGPERLELRSRPDPSPGPDEVLVRTAAIGLNFADLFARAGVYPGTPSPPFVPGMEISGTIEAVGERVRGLSPGERVVAVPIFGGHAEKVAVPEERVVRLPNGLDLVEAAAAPVAFLTAWYALEQARVGQGERVVVTAAAGGVGTALLQLLARRGARTLALAGSAAKLSLCRELGSEEAGLYASAGELLERVFGGGADVVLDAIGGRLFRRLWRRLDRGGRYVLYGFAAASGERGVARLTAGRELLAMGLVAPYPLIQGCRTLIGFNLSLLASRAGELRNAAQEMLEAWRSGRIRPVLGARFPFERLPEAHRALAGRGTTGKVVVTVGE
jgi:NADPH:quinone reductase-like Zn-dependent oxidoreductase